MEELENLYMLFSAHDISFLIPLFCVKSVVNGMEDMGELPVLDFVVLAGGTAVDMRKYQLVVKNEENLLILRVDNVVGIVEVSEKQMMKFPVSLTNDNNRYLCSIARMWSDKDGEYPAYIVEPCKLFEMES